MANSRRWPFTHNDRTSRGFTISSASCRFGVVASNSAQYFADGRFGQSGGYLECWYWRCVSQNRLPSRSNIQCMLGLEWLQIGDDLQGQENPFDQSTNGWSGKRSLLPRRFKSNSSDLLTARPYIHNWVGNFKPSISLITNRIELERRIRYHSQIQSFVGTSILSARPRCTQRSNCYGWIGHIEWRHVPSLRSRHEFNIFMWQRGLGDSVFRGMHWFYFLLDIPLQNTYFALVGYAGSTVCAFHQHVSIIGSATWYWHDAKAWLRCQHLWNCQILPTD